MYCYWIFLDFNVWLAMTAIEIEIGIWNLELKLKFWLDWNGKIEIEFEIRKMLKTCVNAHEIAWQFSHLCLIEIYLKIQCSNLSIISWNVREITWNIEMYTKLYEIAWYKLITSDHLCTTISIFSSVLIIHRIFHSCMS